jgi:hypothetical protein
MKQQKISTSVVLGLFFFVAVIFTSCKKDSEIISSKPADNRIAAQSSSNIAETSIFNEVVDVDQDVWNPCANGGTGENVHLQGQLHLIFKGVLNDNGFHGKYFLQSQHISGTGETTGDKYEATGVTQGENSNTSTSVRVVIFINNFNLIGPGNGNNLLVHQTVHFTFNANGEVISEVDKMSVECK